MSTIGKTHDGQLVYAKDTPLPPWAHGWKQCRLSRCAYSTWLLPEDRAQSIADLARFTAEANKLRTRRQAEAALKDLGLQPWGRVRDMRMVYVNTNMADHWPLRSVE